MPKKHPMWWNWKKEKSTTGVLVVRARTNRSAMALTGELNSSHCFSMQKKLGRPIFAVAKTQRTRHFATVLTGISDLNNSPEVNRSEFIFPHPLRESFKEAAV